MMGDTKKTLLVLKGGVGSGTPLGNQNAAGPHEDYDKMPWKRPENIWHGEQLRKQANAKPTAYRSIQWYASKGYGKLNYYLRHKNTYAKEYAAEFDRRAASMLKAFTPLDRNVEVYRGTNSKHIPAEGAEYTDPAFTSTSISQNITKEINAARSGFGKSQDFVTHFTVPAGTPVGYADAHSEKEIILAPNTKFRVTKRDANSARLEIIK